METYQAIQKVLRCIAEDAKTENINPEYWRALLNAKDALVNLAKFY